MLEHPKTNHDSLGETVVDNTMGNQQVRPTEAEIGWLAGIIEGEGSITMYARKKVWNGWNGIGIDAGIAIVNTDQLIISKCREIIEAFGCLTYTFERKSSPVYKKDGTAYLNVLKKPFVLGVKKMSHMLRLLNKLQPFMFGEKKERANILISFLKRRMERVGFRSKAKGRSWYDEQDWKLVNQFYAISGAKLNPEVVSYLNEHTLHSKEMMCSELTRNSESAAEMSAPVV